jgi:hypothetical protein
MPAINYRKVDVDGLKVFYREAGRVDASTRRDFFENHARLAPLRYGAKPWPMIAATGSSL